MSDLRTAAQQALEALENARDTTYSDTLYAQFEVAITALKTALAQQEPRNQCGETCERAKLCAVCARGLAQEQEPVAWMVYTQDGKSVCVTDNPADFTDEHRALPLYTHPPRREQEQEPVAFCDPAEYDDFQGAVRRNCAAANSPKRHAPVTMETVYETIINWDEGGGKRSRRELARRIVSLYTHPPRREQEQAEPVAWMVYTLDGKSVCVTDNPADFAEGHRALPLYTHPPRREWVSLTEEEIRRLSTNCYDGTLTDPLILFARAIEAALKERNT